jgi:hypothetical protein
MDEPVTPAKPVLALQRTFFDIPTEVVELKAPRARKASPKKGAKNGAHKIDINAIVPTVAPYGGPSCMCKGTGVVRRRLVANGPPGLALTIWAFVRGSYVGMSYALESPGEQVPSEEVPCPSCKDPSEMDGRVLVLREWVRQKPTET